jgi:ribosome modulation factor
VPDPTKAANDIFQAGMNASGKGEPATACPYPDESGERRQWHEGWHEPDDIDEPEELGFV